MKVAMVLLAGPIKHWWDANWETPQHWHYDAWREFLSLRLVEVGGFLVYRPHHAFKGDWDERGQAVNDAALATADVVIVMTPPGIPSEGTDGETLLATSHGAKLVTAPPPKDEEDFEAAFQQLLAVLEALNVHHDVVMQEHILDSIGYLPGRQWMLTALLAEYFDNVCRVHYANDDGHTMVIDAAHVLYGSGHEHLTCTMDDGSVLTIALTGLFKIEVLDRAPVV